MVKRLINVLLFILLLSFLSSCELYRFVVYGKSDITDYKIFPYRNLSANGSTKFSFYKANNSVSIDPKLLFEKHNWLIKSKDVGESPIDESYDSFESFLKKKETVAFLIIRRDTILYEKYFDGYNRESIVASFSMAKSFTSILIGCAIDDGYILSVDEPVTNYVPELKKNGFEKVTIKDLLQMTAGIEFNENYYSPFSDVAKMYYGTNLRKQVCKFRLKDEPKKKFHYNSAEPQLLGLILERALKNRNITQYMQDKIWQPIGMEYNASWSIDRKNNGLEKTYCCVNARALDFAKLGRLYLKKGEWNGRQIVSADWVNRSTTFDRNDGGVSYYKYQWWIGQDHFAAEGLGGQIIYVYPSKDLIIVRLGKERGNINWGLMSNAIALMM